MNANSVFLSAVRGPIMLVTFGVLMLLRQTVGVSFTKTWPVLFIVFGILKLAEKMARPAYVPPSPGPMGPGPGMPPPTNFPGGVA